MYDENKVKYGRPSTRLKHFMVKEQDLAKNLSPKLMAEPILARLLEND